MIFKASLGKQAVALTIIVVLICCLSLASLFYVADSQFGIRVFIILLAVAFTLSWGFSTREYILTGDSIIIKRPFGDKIIPAITVMKSKKIDRKDLRYSIRTFGNGGFLGYYGKYANKKFGNMTWYATDLNNAVLLETEKGKRIVITPDEHQKFLHQISQYTQLK